MELVKIINNHLPDMSIGYYNDNVLNSKEEAINFLKEVRKKLDFTPRMNT